jgi:hypothetical protein
MKPYSKNPVSLEALLRMKRSEQPTEEFWDDFGYTLQRRILREAARPVLSLKQRFLSVMVRFRWLGTAAAIVLGLCWVRENFWSHLQPAGLTRFVALERPDQGLKRVHDCQNIVAQRSLKICYDHLSAIHGSEIRGNEKMIGRI